ncbi:hypothetical protein COV20_00015 [Candidatus Woesearchaeota archaeon CG10_big_fil_rev_8_21_14_0_10_45_16]|nr:MAG: hypothetical protein COV20_00015 [Candidatus Woesearchaeota archaeon CG10_big_fil_rev_8_21_14_0_10_45_16]
MKRVKKRGWTRFSFNASQKQILLVLLIVALTFASTDFKVSEFMQPMQAVFGSSMITGAAIGSGTLTAQLDHLPGAGSDVDYYTVFDPGFGGFITDTQDANDDDTTDDGGNGGTDTYWFNAPTAEYFIYIGSNYTFDRVYFNVSSVIAPATHAWTWQYNNGTDWRDLTVFNETAAFWFDGVHRINWTEPIDWAKNNISSGGPFYFVRFNCTTGCADGITASQVSIDTTDSCGNINGVVNLRNDVTGAGTCFNVNQSNTVLNCNGHTINYAKLGLSSSYGINISGVDNVTINGCTITNANSTGINNHGIVIRNSYNTTVKNFTIIANTDGIVINSSRNTTVINGVSEPGSGSRSFFIYSSNLTTIRNVTLTDFIYVKSSNDTTLDNVSITASANLLITLLSKMVIKNSAFTFSGASGRFAVMLSMSHESILENNTFNFLEAGLWDPALRLNNTNNSIIRNNSILARGDANTAENGLGGHAIVLDNSSLNYLINNNVTLGSNDTAHIKDRSVGPNYLTYVNDFGLINWSIQNLTLYYNLTLDNTIYLQNNVVGIHNDKGLRTINTSASIQIRGLTYGTTPALLKNGERCDTTVLCNITSYASGILYANVSSFSNYTTVALIPPNVTNLTPVLNSIPSIADVIEIGANVTDDGIVSVVLANISYPNGSNELLTLSNSTGHPQRFNVSFTIPTLVGKYNITFIANDSSNAINNTEMTNFTVQSLVVPNVTNVSPSPDSVFNFSTVIEIGANVTDDGIVSVVLANISYPNGSNELLTLSNSTGHPRRFNVSFTIPTLVGKYNITFIANDTINNINNTEMTNFTATVGCGTLRTNVTLTQNISASGTCFIVGAHNIVINGAGFSVTGNGSGSGVNITHYHNTTVKNFDGILNFSNSIVFFNSSGSLVYNNTLNATNNGITLTQAVDLNVSFNTIYAAGQGLAFVTGGSSENNTFASNWIRGTGLNSRAVEILGGNVNNTFSYNTFIGNGTGNTYALSLSGDNNTFSYDRFNSTNTLEIRSTSTAQDNRFINVILLGSPNFTSSSMFSIDINVNTTPAADPIPNHNLSYYLTIKNTTPGGYIDFNLSYLDSDATGLNESSIRIYHYNDTNRSWKVLAASSVNITNNIISSGNISSFSLFAPLANITTTPAPEAGAGAAAVSSGGGSSGGSSGGESTCQTSWACSEWSDCQAGIQRRTCTDSNRCAEKPNMVILSSEKPKESRSCIASGGLAEEVEIPEEEEVQGEEPRGLLPLVGGAISAGELFNRYSSTIIWSFLLLIVATLLLITTKGITTALKKRRARMSLPRPLPSIIHGERPVRFTPAEVSVMPGEFGDRLRQLNTRIGSLRGSQKTAGRVISEVPATQGHVRSRVEELKERVVESRKPFAAEDIAEMHGEFAAKLREIDEQLKDIKVPTAKGHFMENLPSTSGHSRLGKSVNLEEEHRTVNRVLWQSRLNPVNLIKKVRPEQKKAIKDVRNITNKPKKSFGQEELEKIEEELRILQEK